MGTQIGKDRRANAAWRGVVPAALVDAVVCRSPNLRRERGLSLLLLLHHVIQHGRCATQPLHGQKSVRQKAHGGVVVETGPRASLEVVQSQLLFELLVALLDVPAALPQ